MQADFESTAYCGAKPADCSCGKAPIAPLPAAQAQLADPATLEAFEEKAMGMIAAKKEGKTTSKACLKRPAPAPKKKVQKGTPAKVFGCLQCRGNVRGCDTCQN